MKRYLTILRVYDFSPFNSYYLALLVCIVLLAVLSSCDTGSKGRYKFQAESMHWLQFRGPNASGIAPEDVNPPIYFSADTNLLWKTEILPGWSSPCIVNERVFLTGFDDSDSLLYTFAINRENGTILWKDSVQPTGYFSMHPINSYASSTIASDGERIFASFPNYGLIAYELDGNRIWNFPHEIIAEFYYGGASPVVVDSIVILLINSKTDPRIVALDCQTGDSVWTIRAAGEQWASLRSCATPIIHDDLMIMHFKQAIVAYNLFDRKPKWWLFTPTSSVGTPVITDNMLFLNTWVQGGEEKERGDLLSFNELLNKCDKDSNGTIEQAEISDDLKMYHRPEIPDAPHSALYYKSNMFFNYADANKNQAIEESEWNDMLEFASTFFKEHGMLALSIEGSGERAVMDIKWKVNEDTPETPSPLVVSENVLFIKDGGIVTVINHESGEVIHKERIGATGGYLSSPILAGNKIITCSFNGTVTVLSADDFGVLAHNKLKEKIGASPVAVDDVLYVRTDKHLYAFRDQ